MLSTADLGRLRELLLLTPPLVLQVQRVTVHVLQPPAHKLPLFEPRRPPQLRHALVGGAGGAGGGALGCEGGEVAGVEGGAEGGGDGYARDPEEALVRGSTAEVDIAVVLVEDEVDVEGSLRIA